VKNKLYLPRIPYVVFELVKIDVQEFRDQTAKSEEYKATQIDTVYLAVMPESYDFEVRGRNAITQTTDKVYMDTHAKKYETVSISGTFGDTPRLIGGTFMDGWNRLKQFEDRIIAAKLETYMEGEKGIQDEVNKNKVILAINYYDFLWQKFGSIDVSSWRVNSNAKQNTNYIHYTFAFSVIGDLIGVKEGFSDGDPLLYSLNTVLGKDAQKFIDNSVNYVLYEAGEYTKWLGMLDALSAATYLIQDVVDMANNYATGATRELEERLSQITNVADIFG